MRRLVPLALALGTLPLAAQDTPPLPQRNPPSAHALAPPPPTGSIHGTVFCGDTHKPARGAFIMIQEIPSANGEHPQSSQPGMARTGMDGSYTIPRVTEGNYGVVALLPGYLSVLNDLTQDDFEAGGNDDAIMAKKFAEGGVVTVTAHQTASHDITLQRGASFSGHVLYSDGSPATQVNIDIEDTNAKPPARKPGQPDIDFSAMMRTMFTHQTNGTDDQGNFRISGISPGTYRIAAVSAPSFDVEGDYTEGMAMMAGMITDRSALHIYAGDTLHKNAAKTYEVRPADDITGLDIVIPLNAFHKVGGILAAQDGRTINQATLTLTDTTDDSFHFTAKLTDDGTFAFPTIPSGTYKLAAADARIMEPMPNTPPGVPARYAPKRVAAAFADADTTVIVKDSDLEDVHLALTETPIPPTNNPPVAPDNVQVTPTPQ